MASPEVLDFARLLASIPGDRPTGANLREDFGHDSIYRRVRAARASAREAERKVVFDDEEGVRADPPDWGPILQLAPKLLAEESKDLEIAALLIEALVRQHGYAGLRDGFRLIRELVEQYWDNLYPRIDEDGVAARMAPLAGLNGEEGEGLLTAPLGKILITQGNTCGPYSANDYKQACELDGVQDPDRRARWLERRGVVTRDQFDRAVAETSADWFRSLLDDMIQCADEYARLCELLAEKCEVDESGYSLAPPSSNIRDLLQECRETVENISRVALGAGEGEPADESSDGRAGALEPAGGGLPSRVETREEAFRALLRAAEFFRRTEPHSPVSYALEQAVRWGKMPLPELMGELIPDQAAREQLFKLVGIKRPEKTE